MKMIVAADLNWGIGIKGDLLTPLPEDMKLFREKTKDSVVIMGRKTLESFPGHKPLKNRVNIVITTSKELNTEGIVKVSSVEEAVKEAEKYKDKEVFVIGGGTVYTQMLDLCDTAYITKINKVLRKLIHLYLTLIKCHSGKLLKKAKLKNIMELSSVL